MGGPSYALPRKLVAVRRANPEFRWVNAPLVALGAGDADHARLQYCGRSWRVFLAMACRLRTQYRGLGVRSGYV